MKRIISLIFLLIFILVVLELSNTFFKEEHHINYQVSYNDMIFEVKELYQKEYDSNYYLEITNNNNTFVYSVSNYFNKQKEIVDSIEVYEKDGLFCVFPILIKNINLGIECIKDNNIYSYESLKDNYVVKEFVSILQGKNYVNTAWENEDNEVTEINSSIAYKNNILGEDTITIWNYKGIDIISKTKHNSIDLYDFDKYENSHGSVVDKYYVAPIYTNNKVYDFSSLKIIDLKNNDVKTMDLDMPLKQDTYINGIVDDQLYYFDPDNLVQYSVNPSTRKSRQVGSQAINAQFYNGSWETINIYDLVGTKKKFELKVDEKIYNYQPTSIYQSNSNYYFTTSDGSFYKLSKNSLDKPILLFNKSGLKEVKVVKDSIYFIINDTLYYYNDNTGIRKIIKNNEWKYNYNNIYGIYKETK